MFVDTGHSGSSEVWAYQRDLGTMIDQIGGGRLIGNPVHGGVVGGGPQVGIHRMKSSRARRLAGSGGVGGNGGVGGGGGGGGGDAQGGLLAQELCSLIFPCVIRCAFAMSLCCVVGDVDCWPTVG